MFRRNWRLALWKKCSFVLKIDRLEHPLEAVAEARVKLKYMGTLELHRRVLLENQDQTRMEPPVKGGWKRSMGSYIEWNPRTVSVCSLPTLHLAIQSFSYGLLCSHELGKR